MKHTTKILAALLLALAMVAGLMPGMGLTAYAAQATQTVTWNYATWEAIRSGNTTDGIKFTGYKSSGNLYDRSATVFKAPAGYVFTQIEFPTTSTDIGNGQSANGGTFSVVDYTFDSTQDEATKNGKKVTWTGKSDTVSFQKDTYAIEYITFTMVEGVGVESITINNSELTLTVGGTETLTATVSPDDASDKSVTWSSSDTDVATVENGVVTAIAAGNATITVTATNGTADTSDDKTATCAVTVKKLESTVTKVPTANTLTYNGKPQELVTAGTASGGTMKYAVTTANQEPATEAYTFDNTSLPTATDAGTYYVWYKVKGDDGYSDTEAKCIEVTINPVDSSSAVSNKALSFTGQPQPLVTAGTVSGGTLQYALGTDANTAPTDGWSTEIPTATEPGTYYVWYRIIGDENHNNVAPACIVVTIEGSASDYTLLASMKTSGNKAFKLNWTAVSGAEGYDVFFGRVGKKAELKTSVNGTSCKIKKLKRGIAYKAFVKAWRTENGQKVYIGEASPDVYAITGGRNNRYTNPKKITVKKKKLTVAVGGSKKIKASLKKFSNSRRYLNHTAKIRYFSSNRAVATVDAKGKVTGVAPGTCTVYAVAENGLRKGVKITVK